METLAREFGTVLWPLHHSPRWMIGREVRDRREARIIAAGALPGDAGEGRQIRSGGNLPWAGQLTTTASPRF